MKVYLSGPMHGIPDYNFPAFDEASARWRAAGHLVYSPADMDRALGYTTVGPVERRHVMAQDCITIIHTSEALALLPGWEHSKGCTVEVALALFVELPIYDAITMQMISIPAKPWAPVALEGGGERRIMGSRLVDVDGIRIISPTSRHPAGKCHYCQGKFDDIEEHIQTLDMFGEVTLCRSCYDKAGNSVR